MTEYEKRHVVAKSVEEAEKLIKEFEVEMLSKFTIFRRNKGFSKDLDCPQSHNVHWEDVGRQEGSQIPYDGTPFIIGGYDVRECHFGPDRNLKKKKIYRMEKMLEADKDHSYGMKTRILIQNTKK